MAVTICVDFIWLFEYSPLRPINLDQLQQLTRKEQLAVTFSGLNAVYKLMVITSSIQLQRTCPSLAIPLPMLPSLPHASGCRWL